MNVPKMTDKIVNDFVINNKIKSSELIGMLIGMYEMSNKHSDLLAKSIRDTDDIKSAILLEDVFSFLDKFNKFGKKQAIEELKRNAN